MPRSLPLRLNQAEPKSHPTSLDRGQSRGWARGPSRLGAWPVPPRGPGSGAQRAPSAWEASATCGPARPRPARNWDCDGPRGLRAPQALSSSRGPTRAPNTGQSPRDSAWPSRVAAAPPSGRTRVGSAASRGRAAHPRAGPGAPERTAGCAPRAAGAARTRPGPALTEVYGFVALGALGSHGLRARSARALRPRRLRTVACGRARASARPAASRPLARQPGRGLGSPPPPLAAGRWGTRG